MSVLKRNLISGIKGWNLKAFFQEVMRPIISPGDEVIFLTRHGVDPIIYRLAWEMRDWDVGMYQVPIEDFDRSRRIEMVQSIGLQAGKREIPGKAGCTLLFSTAVDYEERGGLSDKIHDIAREDGKIIGINFSPGVLEQAIPNIPYDYVVDIHCHTTCHDMGSEKVAWESEGVAFHKGFKWLFEKLGIDEGDIVVFLPGYGVCHPFAFQIAWEIRDSGAKMYIVPSAKIEDSRRIKDFPPIGMLADVREIPEGAKYVVPLTGLTVTFPYPDRVKQIIDRVSGKNRMILAENMWPGAFQKAGWDERVGIAHNFTVDTNINEMNTYEIK